MSVCWRTGNLLIGWWVVQVGAVVEVGVGGQQVGIVVDGALQGSLLFPKFWLQIGQLKLVGLGTVAWLSAAIRLGS